MTKIRTLGLYQPFASLMLHGKIETRLVAIDRKPPFPIGKYLIYSTKKVYLFDEAKDLVMRRYAEDANRVLKGEPTRQMRGYALCIGFLKEIIDPIEPWNAKTFVDLPSIVNDGNGWPAWRRVGLVFENMKRIEPFEFKGKQGIGFLSEEDQKKIKIIS